MQIVKRETLSIRGCITQANINLATRKNAKHKLDKKLKKPKLIRVRNQLIEGSLNERELAQRGLLWFCWECAGARRDNSPAPEQSRFAKIWIFQIFGHLIRTLNANQTQNIHLSQVLWLWRTKRRSYYLTFLS